MSYTHDAIQFDMVTSSIGRITLNQPSRRNALTAQMWDGLIMRLEHAADYPDLKVLEITGAGEHFAAGADISEFSMLYATPESSAFISQKISLALNAVAAFPRPTIAKIRGACIGGGAGIAIACDIRIADSTATFAITPSKLGLVYPFLDIQRLVQTVGLAHAKDILFTGRKIPVEDAKTMGLVNRVAEQYELDKVSMAYARSICGNSNVSAVLTKKMFSALQGGQTQESAQTKKWFSDAFSNPDFKEGYAAFLEKRKPRF